MNGLHPKRAIVDLFNDVRSRKAEHAASVLSQMRYLIARGDDVGVLAVLTRAVEHDGLLPLKNQLEKARAKVKGRYGETCGNRVIDVVTIGLHHVRSEEDARTLAERIAQIIANPCRDLLAA